MTSVPKPLKFLRPHLQTLKETFDKLAEGENKKLLADIISLLAMTNGPLEGVMPESLRFRLVGSQEDVGTWGHEVRGDRTTITTRMSPLCSILYPSVDLTALRGCPRPGTRHAHAPFCPPLAHLHIGAVTTTAPHNSAPPTLLPRATSQIGRSKKTLFLCFVLPHAQEVHQIWALAMHSLSIPPPAWSPLSHSSHISRLSHPFHCLTLLTSLPSQTFHNRSMCATWRRRLEWSSTGGTRRRPWARRRWTSRT